VGKVRWFRILQERDDGFFSFVNLWKGLVEDKEAPGFLRFYDVLERILEKRFIPAGGEKMKRSVDE
jgi:hypothetical protein